MSGNAAVVSLLVFEAAGCLMAVPASEVVGTGTHPLFTEEAKRSAVDLGEYFDGRNSDGPWLRWARGTRSAFLRVKRVVDVIPVGLSLMKPMPALFRRQPRARAFFAAGIRGDEVFLLLDPARLTA